MSDDAKAIGGPILTRPFTALAAIAGVFAFVLAWRFLFGIGAVSGLNDGYPWGIWITYDVVSGTALACGGYAVALLCYVLNKGKYHAMVRPAILTSALGYTLAGFAVAFDVGRYWNMWKVPLLWNWNRNSILLEVALCIMAYTMVLWIELSPVFVERWRDSSSPLLRSVARGFLPILKRTLLWFMALGILLPTMHHSSLGALMLIAGDRVHALWYTPLLPLLFLVSSTAMGYAVVVAESTVSSVVFGRVRESGMLRSLSTVMIGVLGTFVIMRVSDLISRQKIGLAFAFDFYAAFFWLEMALFSGAAALLLPQEWRRDAGKQFFAALLMMLGGTLYRFDVFLIGFNPGRQWSYFPSVAEMVLTLGLIALELMAYIVIVKRFPVIGGAARPAPPRPASKPVFANV